MIQSPTVQEWIDMGVSRGMAVAVLAALEGRFGALPTDLSAAVRQVDVLARLRRLATLAGQADSLDRFRTDGGL